jgi:hypothetical protein
MATKVGKLDLVVESLPSTELAFENKAYMNPADLELLSPLLTSPLGKYVSIAGYVLTPE